MTLRQLHRAFKGWAIRHDREHNQWANYTAVVANLLSEDKIKPKKLFPQFSDEMDEQQEDDKPDIEELTEEMGPEAYPVDR